MLSIQLRTKLFQECFKKEQKPKSDRLFCFKFYLSPHFIIRSQPLRCKVKNKLITVSHDFNDNDSIMTIDAHQHFWKFDPLRDSWITDDMDVIRKNFLPGDLLPELQREGIDGCIAVQADQSEEQNTFLLSLANENTFIKGIVGWVDLQAGNLEERLSFYAAEKKIKGFRHVLQGETDRALMLTSSFMNGIRRLKPFGFTYDILIYPDQLRYIPQFLQQHLEQKFVIDHLAKPDIKTGKNESWANEIRHVAQHSNVWCKVSGLVTEADWKAWQPDDLKPYLDVVWETFGPGRVMFGSDWPVCLLATSYKLWVDIMKDYTASFSDDEKRMFWGNNAVSFYGLEE